MKEGERSFVLVFENVYRGRWISCKKGVSWEIGRREFGAKGAV